MTGGQIFLLILGLYIFSYFLCLFGIYLLDKSYDDKVGPRKYALALLGPILLIMFIIFQMLDHSDYREHQKNDDRIKGK